MSRLPVPGQDADIWGDVLNDFLAVSHLDDGRIRVSALPEPQVADGSITPQKLSQVYVPASDKGAANGVATLDGSGKVPLAQIPSGAAVTDATATSKGIVQLAGDLGGTAAAPTVPALAGKADDTTVVHLSGNETITGVKVFTSLIEIPGPPVKTTDAANKAYVDQAVANGSTSDATATSKGIVQLAGDLGGTAAAPTVPNKADKSTTISAGTGLAGGGDLSTNRTLSVAFGTTTGTVTAGDDSRITGAEQKTNKGQPNGYAGLDASGLIPPGLVNVGSRIVPFSSSGTLMTEVGTHRLYNDTSSNWTINSVRASVGLAPTGASLIVDIKINGTTIFTTQANRPTVADGGVTSGKITNMDVTTVSSGSYLTVDVAQVGSTFPGSDLTVQLEVQ